MKTKKKTTNADIVRLRAAVDTFMDDRGLRGDARFYSREEWEDRGEDYGRNAYLTLVIDGSPLFELLNYCTNVKTYDAFDAMVRDTGFWFELGYAWTVHFYGSDQ